MTNKKALMVPTVPNDVFGQNLWKLDIDEQMGRTHTLTIAGLRLEIFHEGSDEVPRWGATDDSAIYSYDSPEEWLISVFSGLAKLIPVEQWPDSIKGRMSR